MIRIDLSVLSFHKATLLSSPSVTANGISHSTADGALEAGTGANLLKIPTCFALEDKSLFILIYEDQGKRELTHKQWYKWLVEDSNMLTYIVQHGPLPTSFVHVLRDMSSH